MHFGASKKQLSLHTGVYYVGPNANPAPVCTISENLYHGPAAIWEHLKPNLNSLQEKHEVDTMHFFSDGPTTQYRQKLNFFLFTKELAQRKVTFGTWNFHEAGHGKGAPDGVGATVKRMADNLVQRGKDCPDAVTMINLLEEAHCRIELHLVDVKDIDSAVTKSAKLHLPSVPGTMKIHQILTTKHGCIQFRDLSCLCTKGEICLCFKPKTFTFPNHLQCAMEDDVPDPEPERMPDPESESVPDPESESVPDPESESVPDPESESVPDPESESVPDGVLKSY
uniref:uncharacterized protein n=1 Tax=Myxine glutinosa TaxID=7769 RepID=UPI00358DF4FA